MNLAYFESGCLCVLSGKIAPAKNGDGLQYYLDNCTCSRHPESATRSCWDKVDPTARQNALAEIALRHST